MLPKKVVLLKRDLGKNIGSATDIPDALAEALTRAYDCCQYGFAYEDDDDKYIITDIDWDLDSGVDPGQDDVHINYKALADGLIDDSCDLIGVRATIGMLANKYFLGRKELLAMNFDPDDVQAAIGHKIELGYNMLNYIEMVASCAGSLTDFYQYIVPNLGFTKAEAKQMELGVFDSDDSIVKNFYALIRQIDNMVTDDSENRAVYERLGFSEDDFEDFIY